jgi:hypothetical protein
MYGIVGILIHLLNKKEISRKTFNLFFETLNLPNHYSFGEAFFEFL